jgi:tetratricopeptide (TPR) repeat protein
MWESLSDSNLSAIARIYRELVDLEPTNPKALAGLAMALIAEGILGRLHIEVALLHAQAALRRAQQLDGNRFETRCAQAWIKMMVERHWTEVEIIFEDLIQECPTSTMPLVGLGLLHIAQGDFPSASGAMRDALLYSPLNGAAATLLCWNEYLAGNFERALVLVGRERELGHCGALLDAVEALATVQVKGPVAELDRLEMAVATAPHHYALVGVLGYALGICGQRDRAQKVLEHMTESGIRGSYCYAYSMALTHLGLGEDEEAIKWVDESYRQGSLWSLGFKWDPILAGLRSSTAYQERFDRLGYPVPSAKVTSLPV